MMICFAFYKITKIALMLWLAERHDTRKYVNKVVTSEDSLLCAKGQVYLIYPLPWLLRVGNIYKHVGLKFFSVSWHSKQEKSIWFEILFFNKNRLDYGVPYLATLAVRSLITQAHVNFKILFFQSLKTQQVYLISQFLISRVYTCRGTQRRFPPKYDEWKHFLGNLGYF